jgi:hypothetical protein
MTYIPGNRAFICGNCDGFTDDPNRCQCGSRALVPTEKLFGIMREDAEQDYVQMHVVQAEGQA